MVILYMWNHAVPPAYYAHLAAFRARYYIEGETSDSGSTGATGRSVEARSLPVVKENVKDVMFYCWYSWPFFCVAIWDFFAESNQPTCVHQSARIAVVDAERSERRRHIQHFSPFVAHGDIQDMSFSVNNAFEPVGLKRTSLFNVMLFNLRLLKFSEIFLISFHLYENVRACLLVQCQILAVVLGCFLLAPSSATGMTCKYCIRLWNSNLARVNLW